MQTICATDPATKPMEVWRSELGSLKKRGVSDDDPRVRDCRGALAYWSVRRAVDAARAHLTAPGVDSLVAQLLGLSR